MRKILIIKAGDTLPELRARRGDFEDWILAGMGVGKDRALVADMPRGDPLPAYEEVSGVAITGSHAMVTEHLEWSERCAAWLVGAVERQIPTLGICYGHQLLGHAMGGEVGDNPNGREYGMVGVNLQPEAQDDPLFGRCQTPLKAHASHAQSVLRLPKGARLLASNSWDPNHAFIVGTCAWGVQFHPEFDREIVVAYIRSRRKDLEQEGRDPELLIAATEETPESSALLRRFGEIVRSHEGTPDEG